MKDSKQITSDGYDILLYKSCGILNMSILYNITVVKSTEQQNKSSSITTTAFSYIIVSY